MSSSRVKSAGACVLALALVVGCGGGGGKKQPPAGPLLRQAADTLRATTSLGFALRTDDVPQVTVKSVDAKLLRNGNAQGAAKVIQFGMTVYLKGLTGGWQRQPLSRVAGIYDPSAILDPDRGLVQLLLTAKNADTRGRDKVAGRDCYRVHATLDRTVVARLVPGITADTPSDIWISVSDHRVPKTELKVPADRQGGKAGTATITFSDFNAPFAISAPAK
jgi:lipoprotein LprG